MVLSKFVNRTVKVEQNLIKQVSINDLDVQGRG